LGKILTTDDEVCWGMPLGQLFIFKYLPPEMVGRRGSSLGYVFGL
jgi:hypothetical protein